MTITDDLQEWNRKLDRFQKRASWKLRRMQKMQRTESFKPIAILGAALALVLVIAGCRAKTAEETQALVDAKALLSFHDRLVTYMAVHKQAMAQLVANGRARSRL